MSKAAKLLTNRGGEYTPAPSTYSGYFSLRSRKPSFTRQIIPEMLKHPHIQLGLKLIKGRVISKTRFFIEESNPEIKEFIIKQVTRFWTFTAEQLLSALEYGYCGGEAVYTIQNGKYYYDKLNKFHANDVRVLTKDGSKVGINVSRIPNVQGKLYLGGPKSVWHVHDRDLHPWYGHSILFGAYEPWYESAKDGGARDIRNLYYYKYAFTGSAIYYPAGSGASNDPSSPMRDNQKIAREIVEKMRTGGTVAFPNTRDVNGNRLWEIASSTPGPGSADILEYNNVLKTEILEGLGIPKEVIEASDTGSGYSGRAIPAESFDSTLATKAQWLISDFDDQVIKPLIRLNFKTEPSHSIITIGLGRQNPDSQENPEGNPDVTNEQASEVGSSLYDRQEN